MIELIEGMPDGAVGIRASGQVTAQEYEQILIPALQRAIDRHGRIRVLYQTTPDLTGFTAGALWDDARFGLTHRQAFERVAVVTDTDWIARGVQCFSFLLPGPTRVFPNDRLDEALAWLAAGRD